MDAQDQGERVRVKRRVVVTGMGAISAFGEGAERLGRVREGRSGIRPLRDDHDGDLRVRVAAQVRDFDPTPALQRTHAAARPDIAVRAVRGERGDRAVRAGFPRPALGVRTGVVVGTGVGGETTQDEQSRRLYAENATRLHPLTIVRLMTNAPASQISIAHGLRGPTFAVASACASTNHALAQAAMLIRAGLIDVAVAGGSEACLTYGALRAWEAMRVLADDTCRPFSANRRGLVLGEGAGMFVLESMAHARARGATILGELAGVGMSADAGDIVVAGSGRQRRGDEPGAGRCRPGRGRRRLHQRPRHRHAGQRPDRDRRNPSRVRPPRAEAGGLLDQVDARPRAGCRRRAGAGRGAGCDARRRGAADGQLSTSPIRPAISTTCPTPRAMPVRAALSNSFAFGGLNAVLLFKRAP